IAQLDRVQVSEACGVGSSPAERTKFGFHDFSKPLQHNDSSIKFIIITSHAFSSITAKMPKQVILVLQILAFVLSSARIRKMMKKHY
ncbi:MAG: hypothetical protein RSA09_14810, partial [Acinetobacter sp.]